jgi:mRNA interferase YafQ
MRTIEQTCQFKRDYKREAKDAHRQTLGSDSIAVIAVLANDQPLAERQHDHALTGNWKDHRDCHVKPVVVTKFSEVLTYNLSNNHQHVTQK